MTLTAPNILDVGVVDAASVVEPKPSVLPSVLPIVVDVPPDNGVKDETSLLGFS